MSASSETLRLIAVTLNELRRSPREASALCGAAWSIDETALSVDRLAALAGSLAPGVMVDLSALPPAGVFAPKPARILLNLLILGAASLPAGGTVHLLGEPADLFLRIAGRGASWPHGTGACLVDESAAHTALRAGDHRLMPLTALLAHAAGIRLSFLHAPRASGEPSIVRMGG